MRKRSLLVFAGLAAAAALASATGTAGARNFALGNWERGFRITFTELGLFNTSAREGIPGFTCKVTMEGSFHSSTIRKVTLARIGHITRARFDQCLDGATVRALTTTLPWEVRYDSFSGTLPLIDSVEVDIVGAGIEFTYEPFYGPCLIRTTVNEPIQLELVLAFDWVAEVKTVGMNTIRELFCPRIWFEGGGQATVLNGTATIRVRLI